MQERSEQIRALLGTGAPENQLAMPADGTEVPLSLMDDETSKGLAPLPDQQEQALNGISQDLVNAVKEGPSSLIDQDVIAMLSRLPQANQEKWYKLMLSRSGWKTLAAQSQEANAKANIRKSVAQAGENMANLATEDLERKVHETWIKNLRQNLGQQMSIFCQEHGVDTPREGTRAEAIVLMQMHGARLAEAGYRMAVQKQIMIVVRTQADIEGDTAMSVMKANKLRPLIEARAQEYPLAERAAAQTAAHVGSTITHKVFGFATGLVGGSVGGVVVGTEKVRGDVEAKLIVLKEDIAGKIEEAQAKASQKRREREQRKANRNR